MTTGIKILIGTVATIGVVSIFAFHKKGKEIVKKVGKIIIPDSVADTPGSNDLSKGSGDAQHVLQLQQALSDIHEAVKYINANCSIKWGVYPGTISISGTFDDNTASASQFYLNRKTVDLDYLNEIRSKLAAYKAGDKCKYPLSY